MGGFIAELGTIRHPIGSYIAVGLNAFSTGINIPKLSSFGSMKSLGI
jgi:hypothetical protein